MIISASRRTDIPAFYWEWFQKAAAGTVCTGTQSSEPSSGKQDQPAAGGRGWAGFLDKKSRTDA